MRGQYQLKKSAQNWLWRLSGGRLLVSERSRHGILDVADISRSMGDTPVIVDVGANVGQSALRFRAAFPKARIVSLEPVRKTFDELCSRTRGQDVECLQLALGARSGRSEIFITKSPLMSSLVQPPAEEQIGREMIDVMSLDDFLGAQSIKSVDLLKIDAEGLDLEVLHGGTETFSSGACRFVLLEVGWSRGDSRHPLFDEVRDFLSPFGFGVFGIYDQTPEWSGEPRLRYANALFCLQHP